MGSMVLEDTVCNWETTGDRVMCLIRKKVTDTASRNVLLAN